MKTQNHQKKNIKNLTKTTQKQSKLINYDIYDCHWQFNILKY